jgi:hypothetical protein
MNAILRNIVAVIGGFVIGSTVNMVLIQVGPRLIPPPAGVDMSTVEGLKASVHLLQPIHYLFPFLAHALGTLAGVLCAMLIALTYRAAFAYAVGGLFLAGGVAATFMIPSPGWFIALDLLGAYLPMAWLGVTLGRRIRPNRAVDASGETNPSR